MNKRLLFSLLLTSVAISGCSHMPSWLGGKKDDKPKLEGERISVLPASSELQADEGLKNLVVSLPAAQENAAWPQHSTLNGNLAAAGNFDKQTSARVGEGEKFEHTLVPRPVVGGGLVYAMDSIGTISAHDAANVNRVRWQSKGVSEKEEPDIIGGGLAYDQNKLYATSGRGIIAAFDAASGKALWRKALRIPFRSAPKVSDGKVFAITIDNQVYAFNAANGDVVWSQRGISETAGIMNNVSPTIAGDDLVVPFSSGEIYNLNMADGRPLWNDSLISLGRRTQATALFSGIGGDPVVDNEIVFVVSGGDMISVFYLPNGQRVWERPIGSINTPWLAGDYLYVLTSDNHLVCFVKYNGRIRWSTRLKTYANEAEKKDPIIWKGPVMTGGNLAVVGSNGQLLLISGTDGNVVATKSVPEGIVTAPVIAGGRMYLVGQDAQLHELQ